MVLRAGERPEAVWPGPERKTAWHVASEPNRTSALKILLKLTSHVEDRLRNSMWPFEAMFLRDAVGRTPLHYAAMGGDGKRMRLLLEDRYING